MAEDGERVRRLGGRQERAHAPAEAATDERDLLVFRPQTVPRGAQVFELRDIPATRTLAAGAESDGAATDVESFKRARERPQDPRRGGPAVPRREDRRACQRDFAPTLGSFCARSCAGASRSPT